jgi:AbrB family looped-hinge helix DNA binding protein
MKDATANTTILPVTVDSAGRIVLPREVRRRLNLKTGTRLRLTVVAERIELTPEADTEVELAVAPSGRRVMRARGESMDAAAATRAERNAQARRGSRR